MTTIGKTGLKLEEIPNLITTLTEMVDRYRQYSFFMMGLKYLKSGKVEGFHLLLRSEWDKIRGMPELQTLLLSYGFNLE